MKYGMSAWVETGFGDPTKGLVCTVESMSQSSSPSSSLPESGELCDNMTIIQKPILKRGLCNKETFPEVSANGFWRATATLNSDACLMHTKEPVSTRACHINWN
jgi:hypothetical protein